MNKFICPVAVYLKRKNGKSKRISLNLNQYRNLHFISLNNSKKQFCCDMNKAYPKVNKIKTPCVITFDIYLASKRLADIGNIRSIVEKYFCDWLVDIKAIKDDNYTHIPRTVTNFCGIDTKNPRVEVTVENI
jgi:hypothetical protein